MKETCKNCKSCHPTYKGQWCRIKKKRVKMNDSCDEWTERRKYG